ncbi:zinc ABC transporter substrate-binding protein AztC [Brevibacterium marinum]|uniref:Zinc/manganese transport system substrate-binding protein n=1 Tax=Brevibacterium marinum TaxID=418643 RepID=A0A846RQ11_9MICO|nr:zinc ABC transporter substrate-binding protein AztC [Brevibacterium marinum]NJC56034.1 zinc/manganese transport system substrate-binding protein [Brevibacterium marinum]
MHGSAPRPQTLRLSAATLALAALVPLAACAGADDEPSIVVTTNILGDVVENLVGDDAEVTVLMKPNADPHSFGISAKEAGAMESADLIIGNGLGLEEGLSTNLDNARSEGVPVLAVGEHIDAIDYATGGSAGTPDPHFWTDPARMVDAVDTITSALGEEVGADLAEAIEPSADSYRDRLIALDSEIEAIAEGIPAGDRKLVTNHHVFGYFAERFDFEVIGAVLPSGTTLASPSAADLEQLARTVEEAGVATIFADSSQPQRLAQALSDEVDLDVDVTPLFSESLTEAEGEAGTYIDMQTANAARIAEGLAPNTITETGKREQ